MQKKPDIPQPSDPAPTREQIERLVAEGGDPIAAQVALGRFYGSSPGPASAAFVVSRFEKLRGRIALTPCKVAILRSFTIEPVIPLLRALAFLGGIDLTVQLGEFNTFTQEILDPKSALYAFGPEVVILAAQTADVAPELWEDFADRSSEEIQTVTGRVAGQYKQLIETFRSRSRAHLIVHSLQSPADPVTGVLDAQCEGGQRGRIASINDQVCELARSSKGVYVLDYNALVARRGESRWSDRRKWLSARMPIAAAELEYLAEEWVRFLHPLTGRVCKAIAVDLDNTLWGGVIGEDGIDGIKLGPDHKGGAWRDVQRALLDLYRRGIILAICSKNNPAEAREAMEKHPGMLLKPEHFAAVRTNWQDKATNLRQIAAELNIGIDAIAFLDDNPAERDWVRRQLPEVRVIELPEDPWEFAAAIRRCPVFERLSLSSEDRERGRMYVEQRLRSELQQSAGSLEDFYRSLGMHVQIEPVSARTLARAAQLTQKTNQFNMTTRRYSEEELAELLKSPDWRAWTLRVTDRFGDNGVVGLAMTRVSGDDCEIDNFLLSCRVIGRTVETAFLSALVEDARRRGAARIVGRFIPTKKNVPARDFYAYHHFTRINGSDDTAAEWVLDLQDHTVPWPQWILRISSDE